jgi:hypothetical protein
LAILRAKDKYFPTIKKPVFIVVVIAIGATITCRKGWLSRRGEKVYDKTKESVTEISE